MKPFGKQHPVLAGDGHDVRRRGKGDEVEVGEGLLGRAAETREDGLRELERDAAAAQLLERIRTAGTLGVEDGHGVGQRLFGGMVIADDEVDSPCSYRLGLGHGRDAAVERDDEPGADRGGMCDAGFAEAIAVLDAVRDEVFGIATLCA